MSSYHVRVVIICCALIGIVFGLLIYDRVLVSAVLIPFGVMVLNVALNPSKDPFSPEIILGGYFFIMTLAGYPLLAAFMPDHYASKNYQIAMIYSCLSFLSFSIGVFISRLFFRKKSWMGPWRLYARKSIFYTGSSGMYISLIVWFMIGMGAVILLYMRTGFIPLLADDISQARLDVMGMSGSGYLVHLVQILIWVVLIYAVLYYLDGSKRGPIIPRILKNKSFFLVVVIISIIALTLTGSRRYSLLMIVLILGARHYLKRPFKITHAGLFALVGLLYIVGFEIYREPNSATTESLSAGMFYRFVTYIGNFEKVLNVIPMEHPFAFGKTIYMDVLTWLPGKQLDYQSWIKNITEQKYVGFGAPPTLAGDMYLNFGVGGIIVGSALFGLLSGWVYRKCIGESYGVFGIIIYLALLSRLVPVVTSGISTQLSLTIIMFVKLYVIVFTALLLSFWLGGKEKQWGRITNTAG